MRPVTPEFIRGLRGSLKKEPSALAILLEARKRERDLSGAAKQGTPR